MIKIVTLIVLAGVIIGMITCHPEWLAENEFIDSFVGADVLSLMAVILTVTLASVANIHLALNRIVAKRFLNAPKLKDAANGVKKELTDNAWFIFWGFVVTVLALAIKGINADDMIWSASVNGFVIWMLGLYILCMFDIYSVVFGLVDLEMSVGSDHTSNEDYTSQAPDLKK